MTRPRLLALTVQQPFAWAICHAGKNLENRTWSPPASLLGHDIAIHAGKQISSGTAIGDLAVACGVRPDILTKVRSAIVAVVRLDRVTNTRENAWYFGPLAWVFSQVRVLPDPITCRGSMGLWSIPAEVHQLVLDQVSPLFP